MSERNPSPGDRSAGEAEPRPIPDGGLGEAMPDWLRRPPAWRQLEPKAPLAKRLPLPDTSVIDLATLVSVEDLPDWLQAVAGATTTSTEDRPQPATTVERRVIPRVIESRPREMTAGVEHAAETEPAAAPPAPVPLNHDYAIGSGPSSATIVLGTLLAVALVVIVVLLWLLHG